jgi:hypothetical protein
MECLGSWPVNSAKLHWHQSAGVSWTQRKLIGEQSYPLPGELFIGVGSTTRVSAFLLPEQYLTSLGYSALLVVLAGILWSAKFLKYV